MSTARIGIAGVDDRKASIHGSAGAVGFSEADGSTNDTVVGPSTASMIAGISNAAVTKSSCACDPSGVKYAGVGYDGGIAAANSSVTAIGATKIGVTARGVTARGPSTAGFPRQGSGTYGPTFAQPTIDPRSTDSPPGCGNA